MRNNHNTSLQTSNYAPEIEARRAEYEQLAEALVVMTHLNSDYVESRLVPRPDLEIE